MKKKKVLWLWCLSVILCLPLVGFTDSDEELSSETFSSTRTFLNEMSRTLNSSVTNEQTIESSKYSSETDKSSATSSEEPMVNEEQAKKKEQSNTLADPIGEMFFISISNKDYVLLKNLDGEIDNDERKNYQKTFAAQEVVNDSGTKYYQLSSPNGNVGYIDPNSTERVAGEEGKLFSEDNSYASIKSTDAQLLTPDFQQNGTTKNLKDQTFKIEGYYNHYDGKTYHLLKNSKDQSIGVVEATAVEKVKKQAGARHVVNDYYSVMKEDQKIWKNLDFDELGTTESINEKTFNVKEWYYHFNGKKYFALYDNGGNFKGFVEEGTIQQTLHRGGIWHGTNEYVTVTKDYYQTYNDFNFKIRGKTKSMLNKTYHLQGWYSHVNGNKYYSLYDNNNKWQGYVNEAAVTKAGSRGGIWHGTNEYVTVTKDYYQTYNDFNFKIRGKTKSMLNKTYHLQGWYSHVNGNKYYSLYDNNNKWQGYVNEGAVIKASGAQGTGFSMNKSVLVIKSGYSIWNNFSWKEKNRTNSLINKTYQVKWYYKHMNGSTYYSLYDANGKWFGYVNCGAVRERRGVSHYLGNTRQKVLNELNAHQYDRFYLGTPFRLAGFSNPEMFLVPNGVPSVYGPGMNCTGFVATVTRRSGGNLNRISGITSGVGGYVNAYNWRDALTRNVEYYSFSSIDALLRSGKAQKGDLIYLEAVFTNPTYDCHIGIFWGNSPSENRFWHQVIDGNKISHIYSGTPYSKVYLFPQD